MSTSNPASSFGALLKEHRERCGLSQMGLKERSGVHAGLISLFERNKKMPRIRLARALAAKLDLAGDEENRFLRAALPYPEAEDKDGERLIRRLKHVVRTMNQSERGQLINAIAEILQKAKHKAPSKLSWTVIPVAGWQSQMLTLAQTADLIISTVEELRAAKLSHFIVVRTRAQQGLMDELKNRLKEPVGGIKLDHVIQTRPGLGGAVLDAWEKCREEPIFVATPDDRLKPYCAVKIKEMHIRTGKSVLAVRTLRAEERKLRRYYGVVETKDGDGELMEVTQLQEKPLLGKRGGRILVGRFLLTPVVRQHLLRLGNPQEEALELTNGLQSLIDERQEEVFAFEETGQHISIATERDALQKKVDELTRPRRSVGSKSRSAP